MKPAGYKTAGFLLAAAGAVLLNGCAIIALPGAAGAVGSTRSNSEWKGYPKYDVDPQVIYRIDDHRYVTMENYPDCKFANYTSGNHEVYYHDDKLGIKKKLGPGIAPYQGKLIIAAPAGKNLALPGVPWGGCTFRDKGCSVTVAYSTDSGRTWAGIQYMEYAKRAAETKDYTVVVTDDAVYIENAAQRHYLADRYPLAEGIDYRKPPLPAGYAIARGFPLPLVRTPSGMDHLVCDPTIIPRSVTYSKPASPQ